MLLLLFSRNANLFTDGFCDFIHFNDWRPRKGANWPFDTTENDSLVSLSPDGKINDETFQFDGFRNPNDFPEGAENASDRALLLPCARRSRGSWRWVE